MNLPCSSDISTYLLFNVQGLCPQTKPSKVPYLEEFLSNSNKVFLALTETWLNHEYFDSELSIEGFNLFRSDRNRCKPKRGRLSGGVCIYIRDDIAVSFKTVVQFSNGVVELLCVYSNVFNLCIVVLYRQPDQSCGFRSNTVHFKAALKALNEFLVTVEGCTPDIVFCGDFNLPHVAWSAGLSNSNSSNEEKRMAIALNEFCVNYGLNQCINLPTHRAGNVLDLVFVSQEDLCHSYKCCDIPDEISHHKIIEVNTSYNFGDKISVVHPPERKGLFRYNFFDDTVDWDAVSAEFDCYNWEDEFGELNVDNMVERFMEICENVCSNHIPLKPSASCNPRKRIPRQRRILMRRRRKLKAQIDKVEISSVRKNKLNQALVGIEREIIQSQAMSRSYQENKAVQAIKKNSKYFFSYVKKMSKSKSKIGPLLNKRGMYTSDPKEMANILSEQFSSVFCKMKNPLLLPSVLFPDGNHSTAESGIIDILFDILFTVEDIRESINELSSSSASGPDGVSALLLKKCVESLCKPLYQIYRKCMDTGTVPKSFKTSNITPIFKSGNKGSAENYRPVALTSQLSKVFEKIVRNKMLIFLEKKGWLNNSQHGFRKGRSCVSQLIEHFEKVVEYLNEGFNVDVVYLDFCKAFDKLDFNVLLTKLKNCGVSGNLGKWLHSFLTGRYQFVTVNGFASILCAVLSGVPQGSVLGPLLFLIMINDINDNVQNAFLSSFADDTRMGMAIKNPTDVKCLQDDLDRVYAWANDNNMMLNSSKFELLKYGNDKLLKDAQNYTSSTGHPIDHSDSVKDLGVMMSVDCNFTSHIDYVVSKVNKMVSWALRNFQCRSKVFILTIWKSILLPHLDYCSQLWSPFRVCDINRLELVQKCFLKKMSCYGDSSYWEILKNLGLYSLQRRRERYRIIYMWSILECLVPNPKPDQIYGKFNSRHGRFCAVPLVKNNGNRKTMCVSFAVHSAKLFNCLPKEIRDLTNCSKDVFKKHLDNYLRTVPDEPQISGYTLFKRADSNSVIDMINLSTH